MPTLLPIDRERLVSHMADKLPLTFVAGTRALHAWTNSLRDSLAASADSGGDDPDPELDIISGTGRSVSFYVGPARRYFGRVEDTLTRGRGRVALVISRELLGKTSPGETTSADGAAVGHATGADRTKEENWKFAPFDIGEVLYHWHHGRLPQEYVGTYTPELLRGLIEPIAKLREALAVTLDECYEDPLHYLLPGRQQPRPSLDIPNFQNVVYRAASERWFGRVRSFSGAFTFEVTSQMAVHVPLSKLVAMVLLDDDEVRATGTRDFLSQLLGDRLHVVPTPARVLHPDLPSVLLESETTAVILQYLGLTPAP